MLPQARGLALVGHVEATTSGTLAVHQLAAVLGLHTGAEADGSDALDAASTVWIMHRRYLVKTPFSQ